MIIWGTDGDTKELGSAGLSHCELCERKRQFKVILQDRFAHLYYLFAWFTGKKYFLVCEVCKQGWELDKKEVKPYLERHPIPFHHRYGWSFPLVLIALIVVANSGH